RVQCSGTNGPTGAALEIRATLMRGIRQDRRKMKLFTALVLAFVVMSVGQSLESSIVRLSPAAFPELPTNLVQELQRRQCTIQQEAFSKTFPSQRAGNNNVTKGELPKPGQTESAERSTVHAISTRLASWT